MRYDIVTFGDKRLREKSLRVDKVTDDLKGLAADMLETMYAYNGVGLAAEQVGRREAMFVLDVPPADEDAGPPSDPPVPMPLVLINPEIVERRGEQRGQEGCLSFPEIYVDVTRGFEVVARFMDLEGADHTITARGMLARAIQHELDHLNGVLLVDQMSPVQKVAVAGKLKRLKRQNRGA